MMKVEELQIQRNYRPLKIEDIQFLEKTPQRISGENPQPATVSFAELLNQKIDDQNGLKFSAHAMNRIREREMEMSPVELERLAAGFKLAEEKGARSSLILVDDQAYIVSVKNRTVVTALPREHSVGNVFTNIDSVAIM